VKFKKNKNLPKKEKNISIQECGDLNFCGELSLILSFLFFFRVFTIAAYIFTGLTCKATIIRKPNNKPDGRNHHMENKREGQKTKTCDPQEPKKGESSTIISLEPCALNADFQHFILNFNQNLMVTSGRRVWGERRPKIG
jgi:hypothetical protein